MVCFVFIDKTLYIYVIKQILVLAFYVKGCDLTVQPTNEIIHVHMLHVGMLLYVGIVLYVGIILYVGIRLYVVALYS